MNKTNIIGMVLIFGIMIAYSYWMMPSEQELKEAQYRRDSITMVQRTNDSLVQLRMEQQLIKQQSDSLVRAMQPVEDKVDANKGRYGVFAGASVGKDDDYILENDKLRVTVSSKGGRVTHVELKEFRSHDSLPLVLMVKDSSEFNLKFFAQSRNINTQELYFQPQSAGEKHHLKVSGDETLNFSMRLYTDSDSSVHNSGQYLEYSYTLRGDDYMVDMSMNLVNMDQVIDMRNGYLDLEWMSTLRQQEKNIENEQNNSTIYYKPNEDDVDKLNERKDDEEVIDSRLKWVSFKQQFFASTLVAGEHFLNAELTSKKQWENKPGYVKTMHAALGIPVRNVAQQRVAMQFYFGPTKYRVLESYDMQLEDQVPLGWGILNWINRFAVLNVFNFLEQFNWNYGIIILVLTILLKLVLFPIAYKTYLSSAKMRVLKPEVEAINEKFPKKEDAMKKQQAVMQLYKKAGANPASGCVPMLLQMPILIAMFRFFPAAFELRQESFLWATDLSTYDSILDLSFKIPFYGDHVSLFTLLMTISTLIYTKMNNDMMGGTSNQMPGMKTMMYMMPIMFLGFFNNYSAGLSYYYLLANVITFSQMFIFRKMINEDKLRKKIEANKKKPVKKSKWQQRMENMQKMQQQQLKGQKRK